MLSTNERLLGSRRHGCAGRGVGQPVFPIGGRAVQDGHASVPDDIPAPLLCRLDEMQGCGAPRGRYAVRQTGVDFDRTEETKLPPVWWLSGVRGRAAAAAVAAAGLWVRWGVRREVSQEGLGHCCRSALPKDIGRHDVARVLQVGREMIRRYVIMVHQQMAEMLQLRSGVAQGPHSPVHVDCRRGAVGWVLGVDVLRGMALVEHQGKDVEMPQIGRGADDVRQADIESRDVEGVMEMQPHLCLKQAHERLSGEQPARQTTEGREDAPVPVEHQQCLHAVDLQ
mmetsp:Transcript_17931/g.50993  ORF Transcript_17931/g.50993 Transcript_17931/m.50993 type:complete len:282 (-) Transcript_17931:95-940(-)